MYQVLKGFSRDSPGGLHVSHSARRARWDRRPTKAAKIPICATGPLVRAGAQGICDQPKLIVPLPREIGDPALTAATSMASPHDSQKTHNFSDLQLGSEVQGLEVVHRDLPSFSPPDRRSTREIQIFRGSAKLEGQGLGNCVAKGLRAVFEFLVEADTRPNLIGTEQKNLLAQKQSV